MLTGVKKFIAGTFITSLFKSLATDRDTQTTVIGFIAAGFVAAKIDWGLVLSGDPNALGDVAKAATIALFSFFTNRPDKKASK